MCCSFLQLSVPLHVCGLSVGEVDGRCIVDENVNATKLGHRGINGALHSLLITNVALQVGVVEMGFVSMHVHAHGLAGLLSRT